MQEVDEKRAPGSDELPVATSIEHFEQKLAAHLREARVRRDLPLEIVLQAAGHSPGVERHGFHHDALRKD
jgi:hypothetical protein